MVLAIHSYKVPAYKKIHYVIPLISFSMEVQHVLLILYQDYYDNDYELTAYSISLHTIGWTITAVMWKKAPQTALLQQSCGRKPLKQEEHPAGWPFELGSLVLQFSLQYSNNTHDKYLKGSVA